MFKKDSLRARPWVFKFLMNLWRPFRGPGIRIREVSKDFRKILVTLPLRRYNRSIAGTHSSGNLYAMCEPFHMLMLQWNLGEEFSFRDCGGSIEHIKLAKGTVSAKITLSDSQLDHIRKKTENNAGYRPGFFVDIVDQDQELIARVTKNLDIRKNRQNTLTDP